jgi:hypothetical protein
MAVVLIQRTASPCFYIQKDTTTEHQCRDKRLAQTPCAYNLRSTFKTDTPSNPPVFLTLSEVPMADPLEVNLETLGKTLAQRASGIRRLAGEILDGDFRRRLLELAQDYDRQAAKLGSGTIS